MSPIARTPERPRADPRATGPVPAASVSGWFVAPAMLLASACGVILVLRGPDRAFGIAVAALVGLAIAWMLVSVFWPARADRTCPACGRETLGRLDSRTTRGVACVACDHVDADQSSFLMAEEEVLIEPLVLAERGRRGGIGS